MKLETMKIKVKDKNKEFILKLLNNFLVLSTR